jgi:hypothetical protein
MKTTRYVALFVALLCSGSCASAGAAVGELETPTGQKQAITLVWKSEALDPTRGRISGTLPDGTHYSGRFFEVIKTMPGEVRGPIWDGWSPFGPEWPTPFNNGPIRGSDWLTFAQAYTGRVVANLTSDDGKQRMRCRFEIIDHLDGPKGGGRGECQLSNGERIDNVVLARS